MSTFTDPGPNEITPVVSVEIAGSPLGGVVGSWSTTRELVGSALPGNLRARTGLSIRGAQITLANPEPQARTPWAKGTDRIPEGGYATLTATAADGETRPMGSWIVGPQSGSLRSPEVPVELYEQSYRARGPRRSVKNRLPVVPATPVEPAWMVDALARQAGWWTTPAPVASCLASLPLNGAIWSELDDYLAFPLYGDPPDGWGGVRGALGPTGDWGVYVVLAVITYKKVGKVLVPNIEPLLINDVPMFVTADFTGGPTLLRFGLELADPMVRVNPAAQTVEVRAGNDPVQWVSVGYVPGLDPRNPDRLQLEIRRAGAPTNPDSAFDFTGTYGPIRVRARSAADAPWSEWATDPTTFAGLAVSELVIGSSVAADGSCAGLQVTREADPALWAPPTANIDALGAGGLMPSPWLPSDVDVWSGVQDVVAKWLGAAWIDLNDELQCRNRYYLAGDVPPEQITTIDVGRRVEDLPWTLDPADSADRLEVTYSPVDILTAAYDPEAEHWEGGGKGYVVMPLLWEADEAVLINPRQTITVVADVDSLGIAAGTYQQPFGLTQQWWYAESARDAHWQVSSWNARPNRDGTGLVPGENALQVTSRQVSAGRVLIEIRNLSGAPLWTVNGKGEPWLRMRVAGKTSQSTTVVVERGTSAADAVNPMKVDLGRIVQRADDGEAIADFLWDRARAPGYRLSSLRIVPDWDRDLGDVLYLSHPTSGLQQKALLVKDARAGRPGELTQHVDLVLLPVTVGDFDDLWAGRTVGDLDDAYAGRTVGELDDDPLQTGDT